MFLAEIGTAGVISAYFFRHITSAYSLNVSDPIEGQPVQLSYYLCVFGCGLVFWLLVLLWAKLHEVAKLAKLITSITTLNLCGCLLAPFMKLPLLIRFLVLFQVSSNLALLLIWAFLSLKERMILLDAHIGSNFSVSRSRDLKKSTIVRDLKIGPEAPALPGYIVCLPKSRGGSRGYLDYRPKFGQRIKRILAPILFPSVVMKRPSSQYSRFEGAEEGSVARNKATRVAVNNVDGVGGKVDEAGGSGSGHGSGACGREENRGRYGGNDGGGGAGGGGDRGASGNGHGSGASGSGENSGGYGGHGRDEGGTGSGHGSGASGSGGDPESGGRETNTEQAFKSSKITEMSLMLTAQTTATLIGYHLIPTPTSSSKALLVAALMDQLVGYLCGVTSILLSSNKPEDSKAAKIFADIGFGCSTLGFILMIAMYVAWYLVLIVVLLFGVVWVIFFRNGLKTRGTEVWNYLKNARNL